MQKWAFLFPGQGSQYVGMGKKLYDEFSVVREIFEEANDSLGFDLKRLCFEGDIDELTKTENTQPAILTTSISCYKVLEQELGLKPDFLAGHSLGEFSALTCAGGINFSDAVKIVHNRGKFMQDAVGLGLGAMAAISGVFADIIEEECKKVSTDDEVVVISNYNSSKQIVISGHKNAVDKVKETFEEKGVQASMLKVSAPFHSPLMKSAAANLEKELLNYKYAKLHYPVISNVTARPYVSEGKIVENLTLQMLHPVRWESSIKFLFSEGVRFAVELGPKKVLKNLLKRDKSNIKVFSYDIASDIEKLRETLASLKKEEKSVLTRCLAIAVCTPNNNWNNEEYQKGVIEPYRKIHDLQLSLEKEGKQATIEQMKDAIKMLKSVFDTKLVSEKEQLERFEQISEETGTLHLFKEYIDILQK
ncbi:MAG: ACP S-malonyltransferase [Halanaerobiales bacterium]|nr:ACP S-malonyltransferase [Halanaerobiales bacterium]